MIRFLRHPLVQLIVFAACMTTGAMAQSDTSSITGTVTDASNAVVANAKITIHSNATGNDRSINTNESGNYTITNLPSGTYTIRFEATGFHLLID